MNTLKTIVAATAALLISVGASAQTASTTPATTEEARAAMAQSMAAYSLARAFERPVLEDPNSEAPKAAWRNERRIEAYYRFHESLRDHEAGVRSAPIAVDSTDTARQEAARVRHEQQLATYVSYMQAHPAARLAHQRALSETKMAAK